MPRFSLALQLLTDTGDLDATSYLDDVQKSVKDKALATLPRPVSHGDQGIVIIRFEIQEDGHLASKTPPKFIFPSAKGGRRATPCLDSAAVPFHPLPEPLFSGRTLSVQLTFFSTWLLRSDSKVPECAMTLMHDSLTGHFKH